MKILFLILLAILFRKLLNWHLDCEDKAFYGQPPVDQQVPNWVHRRYDGDHHLYRKWHTPFKKAERSQTYIRRGIIAIVGFISGMVIASLF